ncbi:hypothetical protein A6A08_02165 [Nocardiopsis sp. TSRI0078]|uniref:DUF2795 domain-containing protein n=1 Tax=unclassified Nocardiopsis TaxID=2649073 RepID=UPI00093EE1E2|nr:DUF2795 domain-containing protein [Nocardiopsis sp. TSRI0078]OKI23600.1 hypothetical protein A6A08_02165 [Nocardiopsis sp. TSRI0078]
MSVKHGIEGLQAILGEVDFPAGKDRIVEHARNADADEELLSALRAIPPADYNQPEEVLRSVPLPRSDTDSHPESARAQHRREHGKPGMAESMKETRPVNPIEEELGENRKA